MLSEDAGNVRIRDLVLAYARQENILFRISRMQMAKYYIATFIQYITLCTSNILEVFLCCSIWSVYQIILLD